MNPPLNTLAPLALIVLFDLLVWFGLIFLIARYSGWSSLARRYRIREPYVGDRWRWQHAQMRWLCNYSGCLTVGATTEGLFLATPRVVFAGHPSLFIPWFETAIQMKRTFWMGKHMEIQFPQVPGTLIRFRESLANRIGRFSTERVIFLRKSDR